MPSILNGASSWLKRFVYFFFKCEIFRLVWSIFKFQKYDTTVKFVYLEKMSKIAIYNDISQSYDSAREAAEACILKSLMESVTGRCI